MTIGQDIKVLGDKFLIHFIENPGMAYGMEFGGEYGKLFLSTFRILAVIGIGYGLHYMVKNKYNRGFILNVALIFAGALGNIIDSVFYGVIFDKGTTFSPEIGNWIGYSGVAKADFSGYSSLMHGCVVDMLYFPLIESRFPSWFPIWGGEHFLFFRPVFNIADSAISVGVFLILIFQKRYFKEEHKEKESVHSEVVED